LYSYLCFIFDTLVSLLGIPPSIISHPRPPPFPPAPNLFLWFSVGLKTLAVDTSLLSINKCPGISFFPSPFTARRVGCLPILVSSSPPAFPPPRRFLVRLPGYAFASLPPPVLPPFPGIKPRFLSRVPFGSSPDLSFHQGDFPQN